mmetsp:Transcript_23293/g.33862  ORF Transcript_23293/g.33862 Transcript_23293/m.33862 type:complete len:126 (+) Transcript_23293:100-477(+)
MESKKGGQNCIKKVPLNSPPADEDKIFSNHIKREFHFEVFGRVQGVWFRKYTKIKADELGIVGWVRNTRSNTVCGKAQGPQDRIEVFKEWLRTEGSPKSRIDHATFSNERELEDLEYELFTIKRK